MRRTLILATLAGLAMLAVPVASAGAPCVIGTPTPHIEMHGLYLLVTFRGYFYVDCPILDNLPDP